MVVADLTGLSGRERAEAVQRWCNLYDISEQAISTWCRKLGSAARPQARADRGKSILTEEHAMKVAATSFATKRLDGRILMPTCDAAQILQAAGEIPEMSRSSVYRALRMHRYSQQDVLMAAPFHYRSTAHPNEEWQFDVTNCVQYFLDDGGLGERDIAMQLHKNHPAEFRKIRRELLRYAVVDHYSGMFWFQYYYAAGESARDSLDFLCRAMQRKDHDAYQFHGAPLRMLVDRGSMARAKMSHDLFTLLAIDLATHLPGNPRAKGLVEWIHRFLLRFEARLRLQRPASLEELNRWAWEWTLQVCLTWAYRAKTDPSERTRQQRWLEIAREQLRAVPELPALLRLVRAGQEPRKVDGGGRFLYGGREYELPDSNAWNRQVLVHYNPYEPDHAVIATWRDEDGHTLGQWRCRPLRERAGGWLEDASLPGTIRRAAATATQSAMPRMEQYDTERYGVTWKGTGDKRQAIAPALGAHKQQIFGHDTEGTEGLSTIRRPETPPTVKDPAAERRLTVVELLQAVRNGLGRPLAAHENTHVRTHWPEGCRQAELETVLEAISVGATHRAPTGKGEHDGEIGRASGIA